MSVISKVFVDDNASSVRIYIKKRFHESKTITVTDIPHFLDTCDMYIDRLHQKTHTRPMCHRERNINSRSDLGDINTGVQTNQCMVKTVVKHVV